MRSRFTAVALGLAVALQTMTGCATRKANLTTSQVEAIRARSEAHFARAFYLKPAETNHATAQARQLAPLLIVEATNSNDLPDLPIKTARPQIFFREGGTTWNGKPHAQMTFWWAYPTAPRRSRGGLPAQGICITLNSTGRPVVWEVLADTSGARVIFVAQSLEAQAGREFGAPLEGRRFAIERSPPDAPDTVVARVIEDGPVTMGPIIYLRAGTRDVTTVICRCMGAQARELAGQQEYELVFAPAVPRHFPALEGIERRIRLPENF